MVTKTLGRKGITKSSASATAVAVASVAAAIAAKALGKRASAKPVSSGLSGFSIDASDTLGQKTVAEPEAFAMSAPGRAAGPRAKRGIAIAASFKKLDAETAALDHLDQALANNAIKKFARPKIETAQSEFKSLGSVASPLTRSTVVKFRQMFNQIPVYGSLVTVELDKNNACLGINSSLGEPTGVKHIASVSPADAVSTAAAAAGLQASELTHTPRLYYYFDQNGNKWRLAYIIENVAGKRPKVEPGQRVDVALKDYVIDAQNGKLLAELPRIASMAAAVEVVRDANKKNRKITVDTGPGNKRVLRDPDLNVTTYGFDFQDPTAQFSLLPGKLYEAPPGPWPLEAIGAHANGSEVARFLRKILLRNNIDNRGGEMISSVNCWDKSEGTVPAGQWQNAYWNSQQMVYGQIKFPDGSFYSVASMLDVVGHEMFHGVTDFTSRLEYRVESGALNESYSDIFGVIIANFAKPIDKWVWSIGTGFDGPGTALRNMADPALLGQPKHMRNFHAATPPFTAKRNDYGWVHDNSGIHNFAAFSVMTAKNGSKFVFSKRDIAAMFYVALTEHLSRTSSFKDSRRAVIQATKSLFRGNSAAVQAVKIKAVEDGFAAAGID